MWARIYHFLKGPNPLNPSLWQGRLEHMVFRRLEMRDIPQCLELYKANEPNRFPKGGIEKYEISLRDPDAYFLVLQRESRIIASGGLQYWGRPNMGVLYFGLVQPDYHRKGIGTALLLARLALFSPKQSAYSIFIFAVDKSIGFYRRFGFRKFHPWEDDHGKKHPSGHLIFTSYEIQKCRNLLNKHEIFIPEDEDQIPFRTAIKESSIR
jgi:N-acetylglutamate synthase-like GNAT family acetyltransferase